MRPSGATPVVATTVDPTTYMSDVLWHLRNTLRDRGFVEVVTPVARRADDGTGSRATVVNLAERQQLRSMIGPALRWNLTDHPRIFEIGPCFRTEPPDRTHSQEFTMLDLYMADESLEVLMRLADDLVAPCLGHLPQRVSVAEHMERHLGVDLVRQTPHEVGPTIAAALGLDPSTPVVELVERYVERELEPLSAGGAVVLIDMPLGGIEPCARLRPGTAGVLDRFEVFIDGLEVVHGYQDETDRTALVERARAIDLYNDEQALVLAAVSQALVPPVSVGLGIGIERLCMAGQGRHEISTYRRSTQF